MLVGLLALTLATSDPTPLAPQEPTSLKTIVKVKSNPICSTLREFVGTAITGIRTNDLLFERSSRFLLDAAHDSDVGSLKVDIDMMRLETEETIVAHNIGVVEALLSDPRFSADTADAGTVAKIKASLQSALSVQKNSLNVVSGAVESGALSQMMQVPSTVADIVQGMQTRPMSARSPNGVTAADGSMLSQVDGEPTAASFSPEVEMRAFDASFRRLSSFDMQSSYAIMARSIGTNAQGESQIEGQVAPLITSVANTCY